MDIEKALEAYSNGYDTRNVAFKLRAWSRTEARRNGLLAAAPYLQPDAPEDVIEAMCEATFHLTPGTEWKYFPSGSKEPWVKAARRRQA